MEYLRIDKSYYGDSASAEIISEDEFNEIIDNSDVGDYSHSAGLSHSVYDFELFMVVVDRRES